VAESDYTDAIGDSAEKIVTILAGEQLVWENVLADLFEAPENADAQGALHVFSPGGLMIDSRAYNVRSDGGTYGLKLPGLRAGDLISAASQPGIIVGLANDDGTHTNIGLAEYAGVDTKVHINFFTTEYQRLLLNSNGPEQVEVPANSHEQLYKIFRKYDYLKDVTIDKVKAEIWVQGDGAIYAYATTIDNASKDPTAFTVVKK
jgi:hypothetical protein